jgi:hypothetical protein
MVPRDVGPEKNSRDIPKIPKASGSNSAPKTYRGKLKLRTINENPLA